VKRLSCFSQSQAGIAVYAKLLSIMLPRSYSRM